MDNSKSNPKGNNDQVISGLSNSQASGVEQNLLNSTEVEKEASDVNEVNKVTNNFTWLCYTFSPLKQILSKICLNLKAH